MHPAEKKDTVVYSTVQSTPYQEPDIRDYIMGFFLWSFLMSLIPYAFIGYAINFLITKYKKISWLKKSETDKQKYYRRKLRNHVKRELRDIRFGGHTLFKSTRRNEYYVREAPYKNGITIHGEEYTKVKVGRPGWFGYVKELVGSYRRDFISEHPDFAKQIKTTK